MTEVMFLPFILLIFYLNQCLVIATDYCFLKCASILNNTACNNPACENAIPGFCTFRYDDGDAWRREMLDLHNEVRNQLALGEIERFPKASDMIELYYDQELEYLAGCHVGRCLKMGHDRCRRTKRFYASGQNLFKGPLKWVSGPGTINRVVHAWFDEYQLVNASEDRSKYVAKFKFEKEIAHFTQMGWAVHTHVGCIRAEENKQRVVVTACNYGPGGNRLDAPVYTEGEPATKCAHGPSEVYKGLCKNPDFKAKVADKKNDKGDDKKNDKGDDKKNDKGDDKKNDKGDDKKYDKGDNKVGDEKEGKGDGKNKDGKKPADSTSAGGWSISMVFYSEIISIFFILFFVN